MKHISLFATAIVAAAALSSCASGEKAPEYLILYYSQTGTTEAVATELQAKLGADIELIEVEAPYDGTYEQTIQRYLEEREQGFIPTVKPLESKLSEYDVIFLAYPVWFGTYASPIAGLVKEYDFAGKKIVPICTFGSGGLYSSAADLAKALPQAEILDGYGVRTARVAAMPKELERFLKSEGYLEGEVEELGEFSPQADVTPEQAAIFDAACSSYAMPLGSPVSVGSRATEDGTEYKFTAVSDSPDGTQASSTIYVLVSKEEGAVPEFTQVVR